MHPRERVLEKARLLESQDKPIPADLEREAQRLGLQLTPNIKNKEKQGVSEDGKSIIRNTQGKS